jgi:hypothetical protein
VTRAKPLEWRSLLDDSQGLSADQENGRSGEACIVNALETADYSPSPPGGRGSRSPQPSLENAERFPQPLGKLEAGFPQIHNRDDDDQRDSYVNGGIPQLFSIGLTFP